MLMRHISCCAFRIRPFDRRQTANTNAIRVNIEEAAMRTSRCAVFLVALMVIASRAYAQQAVTATVDENGVGTLVFSQGASLPMPGVLQSDPGPGGLPLALTYDLLGPPSLVVGDVVLLETAGTTVTSDIISFNPAATGGPAYRASLVFYSDAAEGA